MSNRKLRDHTILRSLLAERADHPHRFAQIDAEIKRRFERTVAILVLDMCGFSRLTAKHGVIFYLAMIRQMHAAAMPAVRDHRGLTIKTVADDLFAVFPAARDALEAALDIQRAFAAVNAAVPCDQDIHGDGGPSPPYGDHAKLVGSTPPIQYSHSTIHAMICRIGSAPSTPTSF